eukprot:TRINITY_DN4056_c0_g2_i2.p1 TRINITY_DN4056_c0_g2~~TRINITY_DN4056_c0_g2_i2.p1  ORF type:complete len:190 (-),score=45.73 TRINITY_DN4056_c0_g2_i2:27-596(-)
MMQRVAPSVKFVLPTAPNRPVTLNGGMMMPAWYDIKGLSEDRLSEDFEGLTQTKDEITRLIEEEVQSGTPTNKIIVGGFSQGGASAMYAGFTYPKKLAGLVLLSCYLPNGAEFAKNLREENKTTKFLMCHGEEDAMVSYNNGQRSYNKLKELGLEGQFLSYPDMGHSVSQEEIADVLEYIVNTLNEAKL